MMQGSFRMAKWLAYLIPVVPVIVYVTVDFTSVANRIVVCAIMCAAFLCLFILSTFAVRRQKKAAAARLFVDGTNTMNTRGHIQDPAGDSVEISDPAADDFLRAMGAVETSKSHGNLS